MDYLKSCLALAFFALLIWAVGRRIHKALSLGPSSKAENFVFSFALGFGLVGYAVLFLGMAGMLYGISLAALLIIALVIVRPEIRECITEIPGAFSRIPKAFKPFSMGSFALSLAIIAGAAVFIGSMAPSYSNDSMVYHLADAKYFSQHHMVGQIPFNSTNALWPYLVEMYYTIAILAGLMPLAGLFHFFLAAVSAVAVYALARRYLSERVAVLSAAIFILTPGILMEATQTYVDLGTVFYCLTAVYAFFAGLEKRDIKWAALSGAMCGLGMSVKYFAVVVPVILGAWFVWEMAWSIGQGAWGKAQRAVHCSPFTVHLKAFSVFCAFTFLFSCVWYFRQWIVMGNPFFPFFQSVFGKSGLDADAMKALSEGTIRGTMGLAGGLKDLITLPWRVTMRPDIFGGEQLGPLFLAIIPGVILVFGRDRFIRKASVFALAYSLLWFLGYQNIRFLLPAVPFFSIIAAYVIYSVAGGGRIFDRIIRGAVLVCLLFSTFLAVYYNSQAIKAVLGLQTKYEYLARNERSYEISEYINLNLPKKADILVVDEGHTFYIDRQYRRELYYWIYTRYDRRTDTPEKVLDFFKKDGFTHILYASGAGAEEDRSPYRLTGLLRDTGFKEKYLKLMYTQKPRSKNANGITYELYEIK